ncbi:hypothetical protein GCM10010377_73610 [Streptomyces viridiviolaceus]|nr:hypothetical protein GCM10010377_73610 [Streptomyces viridiviolaceus]
MDFAVGEAAVVVDCGVDVVEAGGAAAVGAGGTAVDAPSSAVGDAAEFPDVDVDELAGPAAFVAADDLSGGSVQEGQAVQAVPGQDPVDGGGGQAQDRSDAGRAQLAFLSQSADPVLQRCRGPVRRPAGPAGTVVQAGLALCLPAAQPFVGRGP